MTRIGAALSKWLFELDSFFADLELACDYDHWLQVSVESALLKKVRDLRPDITSIVMWSVSLRALPYLMAADEWRYIVKLTVEENS